MNSSYHVSVCTARFQRKNRGSAPVRLGPYGIIEKTVKKRGPALKENKKPGRLWLLALYPASFALTALARADAGFAEWYAAGGPYTALSRTVNRLTSLTPFSVAEAAVCAFLAAAVFFALRFAVRMVRRKGRRAATAGRFLLNLACLAGVLLFLFTLACGINYSRYPFARTCGLKVQPSSKAELTALCRSLADDADRQRAGLKTDAHSVMELGTDFPQTARTAQKALDALEADYPFLRSGYGAPKPVFFSRALSRCNVTGMFFPFTFEANVNTDVPDYTIPATMCHELTHLRGYMREEEANFVSYLACRKSGSRAFRYSGDMLAFVYASNALYSADAGAADAVLAGLSVGVRRDLAAGSAYWRQFAGPVADVSESVNDRYLKANRQSEGVKSYGRMVDLLLALQRKEKTP